MGGGTGLFWFVVLIVPAMVGGVVALAKPPEFVAWINDKSSWWSDHYSAVKDREGLIAGLWGALIWGIHKLHQWTAQIEDDAVRAGTRFALFFCVATVSLIVIASLLYLAFILLVIVVGFWVLAQIFGDGNQGRREYEDDEPLRPSTSRKGRSRRRTDWLGNEYVEHLAEDGSRVGRSETKKDWLGNRYVETRNAEGDVVETSRREKNWLGDEFVEHRNAAGDKTGESRDRQDWLGNDYVEHRDAEGTERGRSRRQKDWLGDPYTEHEPRD